MDLRQIVGDRHAMSTEDILAGLNGREESPWADLCGHPINALGLANQLRPYGVRSANVRQGDKIAKGYRREDLHDAWSRYLPAVADVAGVAAHMADQHRGFFNEGEISNMPACDPDYESATPATPRNGAAPDLTVPDDDEIDRLVALGDEFGGPR